MLNKIALPENLLQGTKQNYSDKQLEYWRYKVNTRNNYNCHLFIMICRDANILDTMWEDLTENIAMNFQLTLEQEIERWNVYLVFLLDIEVSKEIKYKIEQDKYCCRKLVEDNLKTTKFSEDFIINLVKEKIFSVYSIVNPSDSINPLLNKNIESIINDSDTRILKALKGYQSNKQIGDYFKKFKSVNHEEE